MCNNCEIEEQEKHPGTKLLKYVGVPIYGWWYSTTKEGLVIEVGRVYPDGIYTVSDEIAYLMGNPDDMSILFIMDSDKKDTGIAPVNLCDVIEAHEEILGGKRFLMFNEFIGKNLTGYNIIQLDK